MADVEFLPRDLVMKTNGLDMGPDYFDGLMGWTLRLRARILSRMIDYHPTARLLDVGFGSGVMLRDYARKARSVIGVDLHEHIAAVRDRVDRRNIALIRGNAARLPFKDGSFDLVVSLSALEYFPAMDDAIAEIHRVLAPTGHLLVAAPCRNFITDCSHALVTGRPDELTANCGNRRERLGQALQRVFGHVERFDYPSFIPRSLAIYQFYRATTIKA